VRVRRSLPIITTLLGVMLSEAFAQPEKAPPGCPITLNRLDLRYNHAGGQSVPQLKLAFVSHTEKTVESTTFALSILDTQGNAHPYPEDLTYRHPIPPGNQQRSHTWTLDPAAIDMHHAGESLTLLQVDFADGSSWKDNGFQACTLLVDFHAR